MDIWPWAFIIGIKIIHLRPFIKYKKYEYNLASTQIKTHKSLPIFKPQISQQNTRVFC